jgi:plasmid maintenance system antidote protein VapI
MVKIDPDELLTVAQAAQLRGVTRQAINHLIRQTKLSTVDIAGRRFVKRGEVEAFIPDRGGRPTEDASKKKR